jgi:hypothetical protein
MQDGLPRLTRDDPRIDARPLPAQNRLKYCCNDLPAVPDGGQSRSRLQRRPCTPLWFQRHKLATAAAPAAATPRRVLISLPNLISTENRAAIRVHSDWPFDCAFRDYEN